MKTEVGGTFEGIKRRLDPGMRCGRGREARGDFWGEALKRRKMLGLRVLGVWGVKDMEKSGMVLHSLRHKGLCRYVGNWKSQAPH